MNEPKITISYAKGEETLTPILASELDESSIAEIEIILQESEEIARLRKIVLETTEEPPKFYTTT